MHSRRHDIERNHSATHLVHYVLRRQLGTHVRQQGSLVQPERLRFDFSHHGPIDPATLHAIESEVNELVLANEPVDTRELPYADALSLGAMAFFSEKYGDIVRVVRMGPSIELCGGTHVRTTGQIGTFRFSGQSGVAAGVRRIEAVTGSAALRAIRELEQRLACGGRGAQGSAGAPGSPGGAAAGREGAAGGPTGGDSPNRIGSRSCRGEVSSVAGIELTIAQTASEDRAELGQIADSFRREKRNAVLVLFSSAGRGAIHVTLTDDLVSCGRKAGDLVNRIAALSGGKGGGRPHFASAGAGDPARLPAARAATPELVAAWLESRPFPKRPAPDGSERLAGPAHQPGAHGSPRPGQRVRARRVRLQPARARWPLPDSRRWTRVLSHPGDRSAALDLLAADALITLALQAQAEDDA